MMNNNMRIFSKFYLNLSNIQKHFLYIKPPVKLDFCNLKTVNNLVASKKTKRYFKWTIICCGTLATSLIFYNKVTNNTLTLGSTIRFMRSMKIAIQITSDYYWLSLLYPEDHIDYEKILKQVHKKSAERILNGCLQNGGLYIKIGQGVSAINHILPKEYTDTLSQLQNQCLRSNKNDVQKVFLEEFGKTPENIYKEFSYEAIAAASLAQVFRAKLCNDQDVAVKVQYADLNERFLTDFGTIIFLQNIVELFFKNYNFGWILQDLKKNLEQELDFCIEAKNSEKCAVDLSKLKYIYIPKVFWNHTSKRILTMEWIDGFLITDIDNIKKSKISLKDIDKKLFTAFAEQIFNSGFVHADPHPGNVFVRKDKSGRTQIVLLDHGLYEMVSDNIRYPLCQFWIATVLRKEIDMKKFSNELNVKDHKKFAEVLFQCRFDAQAIDLKTNLTADDIKYMQKMAKEHFDIIMNTLREMPRNLLFVIRNLNTIRAIGREHGDVINRPKLMARCAQKYYQQNQHGWNYFKRTFKRIQLEYFLLKAAISQALFGIYIDILYRLGRSPESFNMLKNKFS